MIYLQTTGDLNAFRNQIDSAIVETSSLGYAASDGNSVDSLANISTALTRDSAAVGSLTAVYIRPPNDEGRKTTLLEYLRSEAKQIGDL